MLINTDKSWNHEQVVNDYEDSDCIDKYSNDQIIDDCDNCEQVDPLVESKIYDAQYMRGKFQKYENGNCKYGLSLADYEYFGHR